MRLVTWNVNSLTARMPRVVDWIERHEPDVLCLQETKQSDVGFPVEEFRRMGYESVHHGDGRWNGVAVLSRVGMEDPEFGLGSPTDEQGCRMVAATCGGIRVHSVYVPNGRSLDSEHFVGKLAWLARLRDHLADHDDPSDRVVVCGDFNVAPEDRDVWDVSAFEGATHVSPSERAALAKVLEWGLVDAFRHHHGEGGLYSWWDYRGGSFHRGFGMRIDLVLLSAPLIERSRSSFMDRDARKGSKPSDHIPVVVDLEL